jgi:hypothetical protein
MDKAAVGFTKTCPCNTEKAINNGPKTKNRSCIFNFRTKNVPITAKMNALIQMIFAQHGFVH